jgi:hypothetical protein
LAFGVTGVVARRAGIQLIFSKKNTRAMALCHAIAVGDVTSVHGYIILSQTAVSAPAMREAFSSILVWL